MVCEKMSVLNIVSCKYCLFKYWLFMSCYFRFYYFKYRIS